MQTNDRETTFERRKFTITEQLNGDLERLAEQHYQGNVSLCLRAAIEDHRKTLDGEGDIAVQRAVRRIETLDDQLEEVQTTVESLAEDERSVGSESPAAQSTATTLPDDARVVFEALLASEKGLRLDDLFERLSREPEAVQRGLEHLVDYGYVRVSSKTADRYDVVGGQSVEGRR